MRYVSERYIAGGTAVQAFTDDGEPYATCSVCLVDYGFIPPDHEIVVPVYQLTNWAAEKIIKDLAEKILGEVRFGPFDAKGVLIELKPEFWPAEDPMNNWVPDQEMTVGEIYEDLIMNGMTPEEADEFMSATCSEYVGSM